MSTYKMETAEEVADIDICWHGERTEELENAYREFYETFGYDPDTCENFYPDVFTYDEWLFLIRESIKLKKDPPEIIGWYDDEDDDEDEEVEDD